MRLVKMTKRDKMLAKIGFKILEPGKKLGPMTKAHKKAISRGVRKAKANGSHRVEA